MKKYGLRSSLRDKFVQKYAEDISYRRKESHLLRGGFLVTHHGRNTIDAGLRIYPRMDSRLEVPHRCICGCYYPHLSSDLRWPARGCLTHISRLSSSVFRHCTLIIAPLVQEVTWFWTGNFQGDLPDRRLRHCQYLLLCEGYPNQHLPRCLKRGQHLPAASTSHVDHC